MDGSHDGNQYGGRGGNQYGNRGGSQDGGYGGRGAFRGRGRSQDGGRGGYGNRGRFHDSDRGRYGNRGGSQDGGRGGYGNRGGFQDGGRGGYGNRSEATFSTLNNVPSATTLNFNECVDPEILSLATEVMINSYGVCLPARSVYRYELKFFAVRGTPEEPKTFDLSEYPRAEVLASVRRNGITKLYELLLKQHSAYFEREKTNENGKLFHVYAYDRSSIFFCSKKMVPRGLENPFVINIAQLNPEVLGTLSLPKKIYATLISPTYLDFTGNVAPEMVESYLEILFCQYQHDMITRFVKFGPKVFDLHSGHDLGGMCELKDGHFKGVRYAKEDDKAKLIVDGKLSPFYTARDLLSFINGIFGYGPNDEFTHPAVLQDLTHLRGIYVRTLHKPTNEVFKIHGFTQQSGSRTQFEYNSAQISVPQYFQQKYELRLNYPQFPLVIKRVRGQDTYYPMECLRIQLGQKIQREKMNPQQETNMIRLAQRLPLALMDHINNQKQEALLGNADPYLQDVVEAAEVGINPHMDVVPAKILSAPMITYSTSSKKINFAEWGAAGNDLFVKPATINAFVVFFYQANEYEVSDFVGKLVIRANRLGMELGVHKTLYHQLNDQDINLEVLTALVERYRDLNSITYALFVGDDKKKNLHDLIKATEVKSGIATQQIMPKTLAKAGAATLTNIIQKMNPKNGGFNHFFQQAQPCSLPGGRSFDLFKTFMKGTMVLGIFVSHPQPGTSEDELRRSPSVGGYAYNIRDEGNVARGGFFYTKCYEEGHARRDGSIPFVRKVSLDEEYQYPFKNALKHYHDANGKYPQRVLVYRFGASDGEFVKIQSDEAIAMTSALIDVVDESKSIPHLTIIVVRRQHNTRLFKQRETIDPNEKAPQQNVTPGLCTKGYNPHEVVMVPHRALQGSARPTIFTRVFCDEPEIPSEDVLNNVTHALCYMHEIVSSAISVPAHLRNAEQMANRGRRLWITKGHEFTAGMNGDDFPAIFAEASEDLNPSMKTRYWA